MSKHQEQPVDVSVSCEGSIFMFEPLTEAARQWCEEHLPADAQWFGNAVAVEHRYAQDLAEGMQGDGLILS